MGGHIPETLALELRDKYYLRYFVETGTWKGGTTVWAAQHFEKVWTIEGDQGYFERAIGVLKTKNITFICGDSGDQLRQVLKDLHEPALLWLDAHWCRPDEFQRHAGYDQCPLLRELQAVRLCGVKHVLLIDDARLFSGGLPPECDPVAWPTMQQIRDALPNYQLVVDRDVVIGEPV